MFLPINWLMIESNKKNEVKKKAIKKTIIKADKPAVPKVCF